ncbi:MAG: hypothetical protein ACI4EI_12360 [Muricoprocola sp.]
MAKPEVCNEKAITEGDLHGFFIVTGTHVNSNYQKPQGNCPGVI